MRVSLVLVIALALAAPLLASTSDARADAPAAATSAALAPLLGRLAQHAEQVEEMKRRGSFTLNGKMEELDGSGRVEATKEMTVRLIATPTERLSEIVKYTEDGADRTAEAQKKAAKRKAEHKQDRMGKARNEVRLPFLASEQPRYAFSLAERDPRDANRVRIAFVPHATAENAFKGSAWVEEGTGQVLTMGFSPTKNPRFVDHVDITMRFDLTTPLGRAPSTISFDARGGFLVIKKHYRGSATISDARVAF